MLLPLLMSLGYSADRVIIISRHGVRRQFPSKVFNFSLYAPGKHFDTSDESWGAAGGPHGSKEEMGVLTQHGYAAVKLMGAYQRHRYKSLVPGCEGIHVYCEENMPRDAKTAEAFFKGLGCEKTPPLHSEGAEYLIDQGSSPRGDDGQCALGTQAQVCSGTHASPPHLTLATRTSPQHPTLTLALAHAHALTRRGVARLRSRGASAAACASTCGCTCRASARCPPSSAAAMRACAASRRAAAARSKSCPPPSTRRTGTRPSLDPCTRASTSPSGSRLGFGLGLGLGLGLGQTLALTLTLTLPKTPTKANPNQDPNQG